MHDLTAKRTLVKSPPELWSELSEVERLARHLGAFGEIKITKLEPEHTVAWEGESASGTVMIEPSGWGTKVTLNAHVEQGEPEPESAAVEEPEPAAAAFAPDPGPVRKPGFFARLFAWGPPDEPPAPVGQPEPEPVTAEPVVEDEPEPAMPDAQAVLEDALEALGSAHHRPFSRG
jgi:hypothetical protein